MKLQPEHSSKIDPFTEETLMQAQGDEEVEAIITLSLSQPLKKEPFHPKEFPSYKDYRKALINYRQQEFRQGLGDSLTKLNRLSLEIVSGGKLSRVLAVKGTARQLVQALDFPEVISTTVDRLIALPKVAPQEAITRIAELYIKILWGNKTIEQRKKDLVYQAAEQYIINYDKLHNRLRILGMEKPVDLESIYTAVKIANPQDLLLSEENISLEKINGRFSRAIFKQACERKKGIVFANAQQYLTVLGQPGSGKSTFLRRVGIEALKLTTGEFQHESIPVFLELKRIAKSDFLIKKAIIQEFQKCNFPQVKKFIDHVLQQGKILILADGLDEVPNDKQDLVIKQIEKIVKDYSQNRFIVSCRTAAYRNYFQRFTEVVIADFDDQQIEQFINNWFNSYEDTEAGMAKECWKLLNKPEYKSAKELAKTPLLLTFLCLVYGDSQGFPQNRANIYKKALNILLEKWAAQKKIKQEPILREFGLEKEIVLLSEIAYKNFKANKLFFSKEEVIEQIQDFIDNNLSVSSQLKSERIFYGIEVEKGILVERANNIYSFSHLTIQEYLTAQYIVNNNLIEDLVVSNIVDEKWQENKRWHEVFLLVSGLMTGQAGADGLLFLIEKQTQKFLNTSKLKALISWSKRITDGSRGHYSSSAKQAIAYANINANVNPNTNGYALAKALANDLAVDQTLSLACDFSNALEHSRFCANCDLKLLIAAKRNIEQLKKLNIFVDVDLNDFLGYIEELIIKTPEISHEQNYFFNQNSSILPLDSNSDNEENNFDFDNFIDYWFRTFCLDRNLVNLSPQESASIDNYFYGHLLMIQCKEAAITVTKEAWESIESRMLQVPDEQTEY